MCAKSENRRRILYVSEKAGFFGGVERYMYDTAEALKEAGWSVNVMFSEKALNAENFLALFDNSFLTKDIDTIVAEEDFDLVFILKVNEPALVSKLRLAFNSLVCVSDHDYYCLRHHKYFPLGRINCPLPSNLLYCSICNLGKGNMFKFSALLGEIRKCRSFIVLSDFMQSNLVKNNFPEENIHKVYPVCSVRVDDSDKERSAEVPVIMFAGQLIRGKGVDLLFHALAKLDHEYHCLIVGDGKDMDFLKKLSADLGIAAKVEFTGWQDDVSALWNEADIAVFPSRWQEPFGLTGIEAFAHKLPVVGFDVGGVSEWLHSGENGLAVPSKNITALSIELEYLLREPELARQMGESGYKFVADNFSADRFVSEIEAIVKKTRRSDV